MAWKSRDYNRSNQATLLDFVLLAPAQTLPIDHCGRLFQLEVVAICAFAFVLPQYEVPKNVLWIVYVALWFANRWEGRNFGGRWGMWDTLFCAWIASAYASALFAGLHHSEWKSAFDVARYGAIAWLLSRSGYGASTLKNVFACLVLALLPALLWGYYQLIFVPRADLQPRYLGLNSVGHVNHSAIYLAIAFGAALAWVRGAWRRDPTGRRLLGLAVCVSLMASIFVMQSRATAGISLLVAFALLAVYAFRSGKKLWKLMVGVLFIMLALMLARPEVVEKNSLRMKEQNLLAFRDTIWRTGLEAWLRFPLFGVGMGNYGRISLDRMEQWSLERGKKLDRAAVTPQAHGHNLYVNTLAERGIVGISILVVILAAWIVTLCRCPPDPDDDPVRWAFWGGALSAWLVTVFVGLVNTTLHHEHALISMILLGGWLAIWRETLDHATGA